MEPARRGYLGEKLLSDLIREIARHKMSGLLRLLQDKSIKAIFFESGAPVFAISNLASEQIECKLFKDARYPFSRRRGTRTTITKAVM